MNHRETGRTNEHHGELPDNDSLEDALQHWAKTRTADASHLGNLQDQIQTALAEDALPGPVSTPERGSEPEHGSRAFLLLPLATAAILVIGLGLYWISTLDRPREVSVEKEGEKKEQPANLRSGNDPLVTMLAIGDIDTQRTLLTRFLEIYGRQMSWVSDIDGSLKVQLNNDPAEASREFIAIRLALVSRDASPEENRLSKAGEWRLVHSANLLAGQEQLVETPADSSRFQISAWAFPVDRGLVTVDLRCRAELPTELPYPIDVTTTELHKAGESRNVFSIVRDGVEYRLYQTAVQLDHQASDVGSLIQELNREES